jgi:hypothetical protein
MTIGTFLVNSTYRHFRMSVIFKIWLIFECQTNEIIRYKCLMHLLVLSDIYSAFDENGALDFAPIIVVHFVELVLLVIESHAIVLYSHAHSYCRIGFVRLFYALLFMFYSYICSRAQFVSFTSCWHCSYRTIFYYYLNCINKITIRICDI